MTPTTFRAACATGSDWRSIAAQCLSELSEDRADENFGLLYVTAPLEPNVSDLLNELRAKTAIEDWVGTVGQGICFTGSEIYDEAAAAIMLAALPEDSFRLIPAGMSSLSAMLTANRNWISEQEAHFAIVHGDPRNPNLPQIIQSLADELDSGFLVGGLTSTDGHARGLQIAGDLYQDGLSGVLFSSKVPVVTGLTQGCTPLRSRHTVTECERNILIGLDGRPALDVLREDIGEVLAKDLSRVGGYIFVRLPVTGSDTADYLVRNLIAIDP